MMLNFVVFGQVLITRYNKFDEYKFWLEGLTLLA